MLYDRAEQHYWTLESRDTRWFGAFKCISSLETGLKVVLQRSRLVKKIIGKTVLLYSGVYIEKKILYTKQKALLRAKHRKKIRYTKQTLH